MKNIIPESQKIEYKSSWQEEYLEWVCGYANARGGKLFIGVNDDGYVVGLRDTRYLLDILPNQIVDTLGIVVEVDHEMVYGSGENIKYRTVPEAIAQKPENLYVCGILTVKAVMDIDNAPGNTKDVTPEVQRLFDAAPGLVKQLRQSQQKRDMIMAELKRLQAENPVFMTPDGIREYVFITVRSYPYGISYRGHFYIRSGGTTRELKGVALSTFLMERVGKHWDSIPIPDMRIAELDVQAIDAYRKKAVSSGRHIKEQVAVSDEQIIADLKLRDESPGGHSELMRAAVLLFHPDPEKFVAGAYVKIAYFAPEGAYGANKADDIIYHDEVSGPLILQADKVVDLVYTKYLKALVSYEGLQRVETFMTPRGAFREVILNAINHKVYESGNPIQVSVYEDNIIVFNPGYWPEDIDLEDLYEKKHSSFPYNPNITRTFFNAGDIEAYGNGFRKIMVECDSGKAPYPEVSTTANGVTVEIRACELYMKLLRYGRFWYTYPEFTERLHEDDTDEQDSSTHTMSDTIIDQKDLASVERMMEILSRSLSDKEKELFYPIAEYLKKHREITNKTVMQITEKNSSSAHRYLKRLVELRILMPEGLKKARVYRRIA